MSTVLQIKMTQTENSSNKKDEISFMTKADIKKTASSLYIKYEETELTGLKGNTTVLKVTDDSVTMMRYGKNSNKIIFKLNEKYEGIYNTDYGCFSLDIDTKKLEIDTKGKNYSIKLKYMIRIHNLFYGENTIDIYVKNN